MRGDVLGGGAHPAAGRLNQPGIGYAAMWAKKMPPSATPAVNPPRQAASAKAAAARCGKPSSIGSDGSRDHSFHEPK